MRYNLLRAIGVPASNDRCNCVQNGIICGAMARSNLSPESYETFFIAVQWRLVLGITILPPDKTGLDEVIPEPISV